MKANFSNKKEANVLVTFIPLGEKYDFNSQNNDGLAFYTTNKEIAKSRDLLKKQKKELLRKQEENNRLEKKRKFKTIQSSLSYE